MATPPRGGSGNGRRRPPAGPDRLAPVVPLRPRPGQARPGAAARPVAARPPAPRPRPSQQRQQRQPRPPVRPARQRPTLRLGNPTRRLRFGLSVAFALLLVLAGRLVQLQAVDAAAYADKAKSQWKNSVTLYPQRGNIMDRGGNLLADSVQVKAVYADPTQVADPARTATALSGPLGLPADQLADKIRHPSSRHFVYLAHGVDPKVADSLTAAKLTGIYTVPESKRVYPGGTFAANVLGFTDIDGLGQAGLEKYYNTALAGKQGRMVYETGEDGTPIPNGHRREEPATPGQNIELTLDRDLQYTAQQSLASHMRETGAWTGAAVVLDVQTGQVLAMADYPSYDSAHPGASDGSARGNWAVDSVVEPGSVHKAITLSAALDTGAIPADDVESVGKKITVGGKTYYDTHPHDQANLTLQGILAQSSNVGTIQVAQKLYAAKGNATLYDYQQKFGFGDRTGIGLPGESPGQLQDPKKWSRPAYGGIPIGEGVAVTPLQLAAAYQAIANDGVRISPTLVKGTIGPDGTLRAVPAPEQHRVIKPDTARLMRQLMTGVVADESGTGKKAAIPGYWITGKTGTGNIRIEGHYLQNDVASFVGMAPLDHPRFVVAVVVAGRGPDDANGNPQPNPASAAQTHLPVFKEIMEYALRKYHVPPDTGPEPVIKIYGP
jgi:cell division protein FtsI (penicillin-binding protein 3)